MSSEQRFQNQYKMKVGTRHYLFENVPLTQGAIGNWGISHEMIVKMMKSVCVEILVSKDEILTYDELDFVAKTAEVNMAQIAEMIGVDKSLISKWKKGENKIHYAMSYCLKDKFTNLIFRDFDRRTADLQEKARGMRKRLDCLEPAIRIAS